MVEYGLNLRSIQHEMGHECPKTTALYTQLTDVTQRDTGKLINRMVNRLNVVLGRRKKCFVPKVYGFQLQSSTISPNHFTANFPM